MGYYIITSLRPHLEQKQGNSYHMYYFDLLKRFLRNAPMEKGVHPRLSRQRKTHVNRQCIWKTVK